MKNNRREFLKHSATACAGLAIAGAPSHLQADDELLPIVDTHQHLWDLDKFQPPWLAAAPKILNRSYVTQDYLEATRGLNVVKAVYMEVDVDPRQQIAEAEHVTSLCKSPDHPTVAAVISGRPGSEDFEPYALRFKDSLYIKGFRQVLHVDTTPRGFCLDDQFVRSMQLLGEMQRSFDLCMRPSELSDGAKLAEKCPGTRFIVDHCGNADPKALVKTPLSDDQPEHEADAWRRDIEMLAKRANVICKISGIIARLPQGWPSDALAPIINHCLDQFGPERVVFGGDWPVCLLGGSYRTWVTMLKEVIRQRPLAERRKLLHDNAVQLYRLG